MRIEEFDFDLPPELIAHRPASPRDASRLLHLLPDRLEDRRFLDLPELLRPGDLLVFNDTKVIPARLIGRRGAAAVEATLHRRVAPDAWRAFARPARRLKSGDRIDFAPDFSAEVTAKGEGGEVELRFSCSGAALNATLFRSIRLRVKACSPCSRKPRPFPTASRRSSQLRRDHSISISLRWIVSGRVWTVSIRSSRPL